MRYRSSKRGKGRRRAQSRRRRDRVAAAATIIVIVNLQRPEPVPVAVDTAPAAFNLPTVQWRAETAVLTSPLEQEIENLQSDLKKAEEAVKEDIDRLF